jgi:hypothetical protein
MAHIFINKKGRFCSLKGRTCQDCARFEVRKSVRQGEVSVAHICGLTECQVNPRMGACVMFPVVNEWRPVHH